MPIGFYFGFLFGFASTFVVCTICGLAACGNRDELPAE